MCLQILLFIKSVLFLSNVENWCQVGLGPWELQNTELLRCYIIQTQSLSSWKESVKQLLHKGNHLATCLHMSIIITILTKREQTLIHPISSICFWNWVAKLLLRQLFVPISNCDFDASNNFFPLNVLNDAAHVRRFYLFLSNSILYSMLS